MSSLYLLMALILIILPQDLSPKEKILIYGFVNLMGWITLSSILIHFKDMIGVFKYGYKKSDRRLKKQSKLNKILEKL